LLYANIDEGRMKPYNVLFLCTGNSARSIFAEAILNREGRGRFKAYSAGSHPKGQVHPMALETLDEMGFLTEGYRSKDWNEFAAEGAPDLDFAFTVCDNAAGEVCPAWPGQPMTAHWGIEDPAAVEEGGEVQRRAFRNAFYALQRRIGLFLALPLESIDELTLKARLGDIGKTADQGADAA
jgi:arsenate reductase